MFVIQIGLANLYTVPQIQPLKQPKGGENAVTIETETELLGDYYAIHFHDDERHLVL